MEDDTNKDLEQAFRERNRTLREFYNTASQELTNEEQDSLTPILNSLKDSGSRYHEVEHIAEGGEKKISLVHDHRLDRNVAMARAARAKTPHDQEQFLREARLTANLAHPNIMPVYNMGIDSGGTPFFTMELIPGDSLKTIIKKLDAGDEAYKQEYPQEILLNIYVKVCDAIAYAHSRNVLHLDIKPDNIKVGPFGEVFVCDWGLGRVINSEEPPCVDDSEELDADLLNDMTLSGTMKGTPGFMAPEQTVAYGEKTPQTDIYALGAMLYILMTHQLPVRGSSANEVVQNTRQGKIVPPRRRRPEHHIPQSLVAVMMKALSLRPEDRYGSVIALKQEITRYLSGHPTEAEHAGWITQSVLLMQRHSRVAALLMVFLVLLAVLISVNLMAISREKAEAVAAREQAEENFRLFRKEQQLAKSLGEDLGEAVQYTVRSRDFVNAPSMIHVLETGLNENIDAVQKKNLLVQKGTLHFVLQEFGAATTCFNEAGNARRIDQLKKLSQKYAEIKPVDKQRLTDQQLADLLSEPNNVGRTTQYYLYYHHMRRRPASASPEAYAPLARAMLDKLNYSKRSKPQPLALTKRETGYHLDLSRSNYSVFSVNIIGVYRRNVLTPLKLKSLDISHTRLDSLRGLRGVQLDELRMAGTKVQNKRGLAKQIEPMKLQRIILNVKDFPEETIAELRKTMQVVDAQK
jgi:serine/threonine protein kinase